MRSIETRGDSGRLWVRISAVLAAIAAPLIIWVAATPVLKIALEVRLTPGSPTQTVSALTIAIVGMLAGLVAWGLLALLERVTRHPRAIWTSISMVVLVVSLAGPLSGAQTPSAKVALVCMHLAVAIALVPLLAYTAVARKRLPSAG